MGPEWLNIVVAFVFYVAASWVPFGLPGWLGWRPSPADRLRAIVSHPAVVEDQPIGRPIEVIARDARRLGTSFRDAPRGTSYVKLESFRYAYDRVLAEACAAMGVEHMLGVLPPGAELDRERTRVEGLLWLAGLRIDEAA